MLTGFCHAAWLKSYLSVFQEAMLHCPFVYEAKYHAIAFAIVETTWILNSMFEFRVSYLNPYGEVRRTTLVSLIYVPTQSFTRTRST